MVDGLGYGKRFAIEGKNLKNKQKKNENVS